MRVRKGRERELEGEQKGEERGVLGKGQLIRGRERDAGRKEGRKEAKRNEE